MKFFEYLDKAGGFYYERWGDAPVHSIGAALFAKKEQIHWFEDIGYKHEPFQVSYSFWTAFMLWTTELTNAALSSGRGTYEGEMLVRPRKQL